MYIRDLVCSECRWRAGHAPTCSHIGESWPTFDNGDDDAGILAAAKALCWAARPAGFDEQHNPQSCWDRHNEMDQRLYLYRARVAVTAWEDWKNGNAQT